MAVSRPTASYQSIFESLESRRLMSTVSVITHGAKPNDGIDDSAQIQRAITSSAAGDTILFPAGTYNVTRQILVSAANRTLLGQEGTVIAGRSSEGQIFKVTTDAITFKDLTLDGGGIFLEKSGGRNTGIVIDNNIFRLNTTGSHPSAITFTSGLNNSKISNNLFTGYTGGFGIYGYNYNGLTINNNEFVNITAGMHIDAFGGSGNLVVQANYLTGVKGMGLEFQGTATNLKFLDNWYEKPNLSTNFNANKTTFAYSLILDKSKDIVIARNVVLAPERPDGVGCRVGFEVGGDNAMVEDNYVNGINHVVAMNDGVGSASVTVRNNRFANYLQGISNAFPASNRTLTQYNNGPDVQLSWDINRGHPGRNGAYGGPIEEPGLPPIPNPIPVDVKAPSQLTAKAVSASRIDLTWKDNDNDEIGFRIERSTDGKTWTQIAFAGANTTRFSNQNLPAGKKFYYRVRSYNAAGASAYSNVSSATTLTGSTTTPTPTSPTTSPKPTTPTTTIPRPTVTNPTRPTTTTTTVGGIQF